MIDGARSEREEEEEGMSAPRLDNDESFFFFFERDKEKREPELVHALILIINCSGTITATIITIARVIGDSDGD